MQERKENKKIQNTQLIETSSVNLPWLPIGYGQSVTDMGFCVTV